MRAQWRPFPVPTAHLVVLAVGVWAVVTAHATPILAWPYADWVAASAEARQSLALAGPWAAVCGAWSAARFTGARNVVVTPGAARVGGDLVTAMLLRLACAALLGYAAGLAPLWVMTAREATAGRIDVLVVAGSAVCLVCFVCGGYLVGTILPIRAAPVTVLIAAYFVVVTADYQPQSLAAVWTSGVAAGDVEDPRTGAFRILFFLVLAACLAAAAAFVQRDRTVPRAPRSWARLAALGVPAMLAISPIRPEGPAIQYETDPPRTCQDVRGVEVCVHTARSPVLPEFADAVGQVLEAAGPLGRQVAGVSDVHLWDDHAPPTHVVVQLHPMDSWWRTQVVEELAFVVSGSVTCMEVGVAMGGEFDDLSPLFAHSAASGGVATWIARQAGEGEEDVGGGPEGVALADRLGRMEVDEVHDLFASIAEDLAACRAGELIGPG